VKSAIKNNPVLGIAMTPTFQPLTLSDNFYPKYAQSWLGSLFYPFSSMRIREMAAHRILREQLEYRQKNNINLGEYWIDTEDLAIVKLIGEAVYVYGETRIKAPLLPDDPLYLLVLLANSPDGMHWVGVLVDVEKKCNCFFSDKDVDALYNDRCMTIRDFVELIKSSKKTKEL